MAEDWDEPDDDATDPCPECGAQVYSDADQCPECGHWFVDGEAGGQSWSERQPRMLAWMGYAVVALIVLWIVVTML
ncbi:hypothetical protein Pla175_15600 [Pirellulimonas nuda]|uniref:Zinc-ribbon domain-containing protein n=1 Tax=Pirellulimonas nuda TaxID=2528009 RepID=A0A518D9S5_9BACT|nr:hypothetical protein [Pirellulimonas nuda]QDU88188.1 hypothetical protein Pla175_15600 [Pirellulimonas nuda]